MSRKVGRTGTLFQTHEGWGVCCLPGYSSGSGLEFRDLAGKSLQNLSLESRLVETAMLSSLRREMEMRRKRQVQSKARVQSHTASHLPNGPLAQGG